MGIDGKYRALVTAFLAALVLLPAPAVAACRLALVLALDVSSSVDAEEDRFQRDGLANALEDEDVMSALLAMPDLPVALTVYEWSGRYKQRTIIGWTYLFSRDVIRVVAERIRRSQRSTDEFPTALGYAVGHAAKLFRNGPPCLARTLDVAGDGVTNDGFGPRLAYKHFPLGGVTVNGLIVRGGTDNDADVLAYYANELVRGPEAFLEVADDYADFERAMRRKLLRETEVKAIGMAGPESGGPG